MLGLTCESIILGLETTLENIHVQVPTARSHALLSDVGCGAITYLVQPSLPWTSGWSSPARRRAYLGTESIAHSVVWGDVRGHRGLTPFASTSCPPTEIWAQAVHCWANAAATTIIWYLSLYVCKFITLLSLLWSLICGFQLILRIVGLFLWKRY